MCSMLWLYLKGDRMTRITQAYYWYVSLNWFETSRVTRLWNIILVSIGLVDHKRKHNVFLVFMLDG